MPVPSQGQHDSIARVDWYAKPWCDERAELHYTESYARLLLISPSLDPSSIFSRAQCIPRLEFAMQPAPLQT